MPDIHHQFPVFAPTDRVFEAISTPKGLDAWWTLSSKGTPKTGEIYELFFGEGYDWRARVSTCVPGHVFALSIYDSMPDWENTIVRFELTEEGASEDDTTDAEGSESSVNEAETFLTSALSAKSAATDVMSPFAAKTLVRFSHTGWPEDNDHYRISSFCWAMYLRLMKKYVEEGTIVEFRKRLDA